MRRRRGIGGGKYRGGGMGIRAVGEEYEEEEGE